MRPGVEVVMAGLLVEALLAGCASPGAAGTRIAQSMAETGLTIANVGVEPKTLEPGGARTTIRYTLTHPARVRVDFADEAGRVVRQTDEASQPAGAHQVIWDGRRDDGRPAAGGVYRYIIRARDDAGHEVVHDPSMQTGGEELTPREFTFDRASGRLRWVMPRAGRARLRVGVEGFPHLRTLLDWEPLEAGSHEIVWDGLDASGLIRAIDHSRLVVKLSAYALPDNTLIVRGKPADEPPTAPAAYPPEEHPGRAYLHARHPRAICHEARLAVLFPPETPRDAQGRPVIRGTVPVRVALEAADALHLVNQRFEVALYEDLTFLFEEEESANPFTFLWDTSRLPEGAHVLTVNLFSYDDHFGVATQPVVIEREE